MTSGLKVARIVVVVVGLALILGLANWDILG
jgi:hypothetical protein